MSEGDDFDISVHCDVLIFEWLLLFIEFEEWKFHPKIDFYEVLSEPRKEKQKHKPEIHEKEVIQILISAEYLKISNLVEECLKFMIENMNLIL